MQGKDFVKDFPSHPFKVDLILYELEALTKQITSYQKCIICDLYLTIEFDSVYEADYF